MNAERLESPNPGWKLDMLRMRFLTGLLKDLKRNEADGVPKEECDAIKKLLDEYRSLFESHSEISTVSERLRELSERLRDTYKEWNDHKGHYADTRRRVERLKIEKLVKKIQKRFRKDQFQLGLQVDDGLVEDAYDTFIQLGEAHKEHFPILNHYATTTERNRRRGKSRQEGKLKS